MSCLSGPTPLTHLHPRTDLSQGPQELAVGQQDDCEGQGKAQQKVDGDVGHFPRVPAVPVEGAGRPDPLRPSDNRPSGRCEVKGHMRVNTCLLTYLV